VTEGTATILFPDTEDVFYNPVQEFNRDISIAVVNKFGQMCAQLSLLSSPLSLSPLSLPVHLR